MGQKRGYLQQLGGGRAGVIALAALLLCAGTLLFPGPARAVLTGEESTRAESGDKDYAAGVRARKAEDWQAVVDNMAKVLLRRPWHDNAMSYMGFAYRNLGNYDKALEYYHRALERNPHNRGALEYLGETYLDLDRPKAATEVLERLAHECRRVVMGFNNSGWLTGCEEYIELKEVYDRYMAGRGGGEK